MAVQRLLMLQARNEDVPEDFRSFCDMAQQTSRPRELDRMREAARTWARMANQRDIWYLE
ncbi:MAG: hypothetical protein ACREYA_37380 [Cupriavidus necator]